MNLENDFSKNLHWKIPLLNIGSRPDSHGNPPIAPTYAEFASRPLSAIEEMATAVNERYPHFLAVLSPQRLFLHYLISGLVCNIALDSKKDLFHKAQKLYDANIDGFNASYQNALTKGWRTSTGQHRSSLTEQIEDVKEDMKLVFDRYLQKSNDPQTSPSASPEADTGKWWRNHHDFCKKAARLLRSNHTYGQIDPELNTKEKIFDALLTDEATRHVREAWVKEWASKIINYEAAYDSAHFKKLPAFRAEDRHHIAVAGVIASGKTRFVDKMRVKRRDFAFVDLDELKEFHMIVDRHKDPKDHPPSWNKRAHDECHMIRRKMLDELEDKAVQGPAPNVFIQTSLISPRVYNWLTSDQVRTDIHLFYCSPDVALRNSYERQQRGGRRTSTQVVLESVHNTVRNLDKVLDNTSGNKKLTVTLYNSQKLRDKNVSHNMQAEVLKRQGNGAINLFDWQTFLATQRCLHVNTEAKSMEEFFMQPNMRTTVVRDPKSNRVFRPRSVHKYGGSSTFKDRLVVHDLHSEIMHESIEYLLRKYPVYFYDLPAPVVNRSFFKRESTQGDARLPYAEKDADSNKITEYPGGGYSHQVAILQKIFTTPLPDLTPGL